MYEAILSMTSYSAQNKICSRLRDFASEANGPVDGPGVRGTGFAAQALKRRARATKYRVFDPMKG